MKKLTKVEEQIMQVIWKLGKAFMREIIEELPEPKPHKNTTFTIINILVNKKFIAINKMGNHHQYMPIVSKEDYSRSSLENIANGYFGGSTANLVKFFVNHNKLSKKDIGEIEELLARIKKNKK